MAGGLVAGPSPGEVSTSHVLGSHDHRIVITDIRDREGNMLPGPVIESVARHLLGAISDLGLKATVATPEKVSSRSRGAGGPHPLASSSRLGFQTE